MLVGDAAKIRAMVVRKTKTDQRDALVRIQTMLKHGLHAIALNQRLTCGAKLLGQPGLAQLQALPLPPYTRSDATTVSSCSRPCTPRSSSSMPPLLPPPWPIPTPHVSSRIPASAPWDCVSRRRQCPAFGDRNGCPVGVSVRPVHLDQQPVLLPCPLRRLPKSQVPASPSGKSRPPTSRGLDHLPQRGPRATGNPDRASVGDVCV